MHVATSTDVSPTTLLEPSIVFGGELAPFHEEMASLRHFVA